MEHQLLLAKEFHSIQILGFIAVFAISGALLLLTKKPWCALIG